MAFISEEQLNDIRSRVNIVDVIAKYIPLTQRGKNYFCVCPFHDDHSPSMSVSSDKQIYKCFSCGASGNVFTFVQNYENVSWPEAVGIVASSIGISIDTGLQPKITNVFKTEYEIMNLTEKFYQNNLKSNFGLEAKRYLTERGIDNNIIEEFGIGLSLDRNDGLKELFTKKNYKVDTLIELGLLSKEGYDTFARRITFPLWDKDGNVIGFSGRIYRGEDAAKYVNSKESRIFKKGELLYNYHNAKDIAKREKMILVVEGFMDAIRLSASGIKNVVALMGTSMTSNHVELLKKLRVNIILCLDNDNAGITAMINNGMMLRKANLDVAIIRLSGSKDPDEYIINNGLEAFNNLLKNPISYFEFRIAMTKENKDLNNAMDLASYINEVIELLKEVDDPILKEITINNLAKDYNIDVGLLKERIKFEEDNNKKAIANTNNKQVKGQKKNISDEIAKKILYYMMADAKYINIYKKKLGYIDNATLRGVANEILYYYGTYNKINMADFISYMGDKELNAAVSEILAVEIEEDLTIEGMEEYINSYYRLIVKKQIADLKLKMKEELDINKKMEIAKRITELKKGSVSNGRN